MRSRVYTLRLIAPFHRSIIDEDWVAFISHEMTNKKYRVCQKDKVDWEYGVITLRLVSYK